MFNVGVEELCKHLFLNLKQKTKEYVKVHCIINMFMSFCKYICTKILFVDDVKIMCVEFVRNEYSNLIISSIYLEKFIDIISVYL